MFREKSFDGSYNVNPTKIPAIDQENFVCYMSEGQLYREHGEADKAIPHFTKAIAKNADDSEPYIGRGKALLALGEHAPAEAEFSNATERNRQPDYFAERGQI